MCCKQLRLKDERLNPGWESRGYADVEIFKIHFGQLILFFFFLLRINTTATQMVFFPFLFFSSSYRNDLSGTALAERWEGRDKHYVTVIVSLREKCIFYSQFICSSYPILSPRGVHVHMLLRAPVCLCACEHDFSFLCVQARSGAWDKGRDTLSELASSRVARERERVCARVRTKVCERVCVCVGPCTFFFVCRLYCVVMGGGTGCWGLSTFPCCWFRFIHQ